MVAARVLLTKMGAGIISAVCSITYDYLRYKRILTGFLLLKEKLMSYIIWSRRCKKCKGQFYLEENEDGASLTCIQCGNSESVDKETVKLLSTIQSSKKQLTGVSR